MPSIGKKWPFQPETTIATAAAVGFRPKLRQEEIAKGANINTVPKVEPVRVASKLVSTQKAKTRRKGLMPVPSIVATVLPTKTVRPVLPRASVEGGPLVRQ